MKFTPKTEEEISAFDVWPAGDYDFTVIEAQDTVSKSGNEMIKLKLQVMKPSGETAVVFDYLLEAMDFKIRHFCSTAGMMAEYDSGTFNAGSCNQRSGKVTLKVEPEANGWPAKNSVKDYAKRDDQQAPSTQDDDDGIPF